MSARPFVNLSNHPLTSWSPDQKAAAEALAPGGALLDHPFPQVDPAADTHAVLALARQTAAAVLALKPAVVHVAGEFTLAYALVRLLQSQRLPCVAATTERRSVEAPLPDGTTERRLVFQFVRWRAYPVL